MTGSGTPTRARADQPRRLFVFVSLFMSDVEEDRWLSQEWCKTGAEAEACPLEGMGSSQLDVLNHRGPPKVGGKSNANVGRECVGMSRARGLPNALVEPDGLLRPRSGPRFASCIAHPGHLLGASGARRCGSAPWSLRMSSTRPRAPAAAATRAPRGLRASCLRTATERAPPLERQPSRACPPESAGVRAGA